MLPSEDLADRAGRISMQYGFLFDSSRCTGCKTCEMACKDYWDLGPKITYRRVFCYEGGDWVRLENGAWKKNVFFYYLSISCNHCSSPVCVQVCPTGAMHKEKNFGLVLVNQRVCVGCGYCSLACPYGAPSVDDGAHRSVKCDGCHDRLLRGDSPICVEACPMRALGFRDIEELRMKYGRHDVVTPMPQPVTSPSIVIRPCGCSRDEDHVEGWVSNPLEVE